MNKFTLSVGLNAIKKHFLVSLVLFIVTMLLLTNFNIFDNKYELKKIIVPGVSNDEYKARVLEREHIKSMVSSASIYSSLKSTIDNGEIAKYRVDNKDKSKFMVFDAQGDDDLIENYSFQVGGYNFLEPRFYFSRKRKDRDKDIKDWEGIRRFFEMESYKGYPFNKLTLEQWGYEFI